MIARYFLIGPLGLRLFQDPGRKPETLCSHLFHLRWLPIKHRITRSRPKSQWLSSPRLRPDIIQDLKNIVLCAKTYRVLNDRNWPSLEMKLTSPLINRLFLHVRNSDYNNSVFILFLTKYMEIWVENNYPSLPIMPVSHRTYRLYAQADTVNECGHPKICPRYGHVRSAHYGLSRSRTVAHGTACTCTVARVVSMVSCYGLYGNVRSPRNV